MFNVATCETCLVNFVCCPCQCKLLEYLCMCNSWTSIKTASDADRTRASSELSTDEGNCYWCWASKADWCNSIWRWCGPLPRHANSLMCHWCQFFRWLTLPSFKRRHFTAAIRATDKEIVNWLTTLLYHSQLSHSIASHTVTDSHAHSLTL